MLERLLKDLIVVCKLKTTMIFTKVILLKHSMKWKLKRNLNKVCYLIIKKSDSRVAFFDFYIKCYLLGLKIKALGKFCFISFKALSASILVLKCPAHVLKLGGS